MTVKYLSSTLFILFVACSDGRNTKVNKESIIAADNVNLIKQPRHHINGPAKQPIASSPLGIWTDGSNENATFEIRKDSIYYIEQFATYQYSILDNNIKIQSPGGTFTGTVSYIEDTMVIASEDGTTKYWKFKD